MWLLTKYEILSIVAFDPSKDQSGIAQTLGITSPDTHVLLRARVKADLLGLKTAYPETFGDMIVDTDTHADYAFRSVITREQFKTLLCAAVDELNYDSHFKEVHSAHASATTPPRHSVLMDVWTALSRLQPWSPYGGYSYTAKKGGGKKGTSVVTATTKYPIAQGGGYLLNKKLPEPVGSQPTSAASAFDEWDEGEVVPITPTPTTTVTSGKVGKLDPESGELLTPGEGATASTEPFMPTISFLTLKGMLLKRGTDDLTNWEVNHLSDEAFELYNEIHDNYAISQQPVSEAEMASIIEDLITRNIELDELDSLLPPALQQEMSKEQNSTGN